MLIKSLIISLNLGIIFKNNWHVNNLTNGLLLCCTFSTVTLQTNLNKNTQTPDTRNLSGAVLKIMRLTTGLGGKLTTNGFGRSAFRAQSF